MNAARRSRHLFEVAKCCKCGRALTSVRFTFEGKPIGAICYKKASGQTIKRSRKAKNPKFVAPEVERDIYTLDLFGEENGMDAD